MVEGVSTPPNKRLCSAGSTPLQSQTNAPQAEDDVAAPPNLQMLLSRWWHTVLRFPNCVCSSQWYGRRTPGSSLLRSTAWASFIRLFWCNTPASWARQQWCRIANIIYSGATPADIPELCSLFLAGSDCNFNLFPHFKTCLLHAIELGKNLIAKTGERHTPPSVTPSLHRTIDVVIWNISCKSDPNSESGMMTLWALMSICFLESALILANRPSTSEQITSSANEFEVSAILPVFEKSLLRMTLQASFNGFPNGELPNLISWFIFYHHISG